VTDGPHQLGLLPEASAEVLPAPSAPAVEALARHLPAGLHLGTASWAFPGWTQLVYAGRPSRLQLARAGLAAYAQHALFSSVSLDRTRYAIPDAATLDSMGWIHFKLGDLSLAEDYLRRAWEADDNPEIGAHLGEVLWQLDKPDQALEIWRAAAALDADHTVLTDTLQRLGVEL